MSWSSMICHLEVDEQADDTLAHIDGSAILLQARNL